MSRCFFWKLRMIRALKWLNAAGDQRAPGAPPTDRLAPTIRADPPFATPLFSSRRIRRTVLAMRTRPCISWPSDPRFQISDSPGQIGPLILTIVGCAEDSWLCSWFIEPCERLGSNRGKGEKRGGRTVKPSSSRAKARTFPAAQKHAQFKSRLHDVLRAPSHKN